jgi:hypothetical protein
MRVKSITVTSVSCIIDTGGGNGEATIFGTARIDGSGSFQYRIDVDDNGEPGRGRDTYHIQLSNGYDSGVKTLLAGNIQVQQTQTAAGIQAEGGAGSTTTTDTTTTPPPPQQEQQPANQLRDSSDTTTAEEEDTIEEEEGEEEGEETAVEETSATDNEGEEGTNNRDRGR